MKLIIKLLGILIILAGVFLLINFEAFSIWVEKIKTNPTTYFATIILRLTFGILFLLAAKHSKYPNVIKFLGYLSITAAIIFIFIGLTNFQTFIASIIPLVNSSPPIFGLSAITFGGFLVYAFSGMDLSD